MHAGPRSIAARWRRRRRDRRTDAGSMPLAMLVTLVGVSLSAGLGGVVVNQFQQSQRLADRVAAVEAAQAGLDAGLKAIRDTYAVTGALLDKLPCGVLTPPTDPTLNPFAALGKAGGSTPTYNTTVGYFLTDPSNLVGQLQALGPLTTINKLGQVGTSLEGVLAGVTGPAGQVLDLTKITNALNSAVACVGGDANGVGGVLKQVPLFGLLRSEGRAGTVKRTLYATYTFHTSEDTIPGGRIVVTAAGSPVKLCLGDKSGSPAPGHPVQVVPCTSPDLQASFIYPNNLSLVLGDTRAPTVTNKLTGLLPTGASTYTYGLCITAAKGYYTDAPLTFQECVSPKIANQQWNYDVNPHTYYANDGRTGNNRFCIVAKSAAQDADVVLRSGTANCGKAGVDANTFTPDASVGPGGAGPRSLQLVSTEEVGGCLDVTNEDLKAKFLIAYPCKQSFTNDVFWNHKWFTPPLVAPAYVTTGQISTQKPGNPLYCLKSPGVVNGLVTVTNCTDGGTSLQWKLYDDAPTPADRYQIVDANGLCLMPGGSLGATFKYNNSWSKVVVATCTGKELQKWNMPASAKLLPLTSMKEK